MRTASRVSVTVVLLFAAALTAVERPPPSGSVRTVACVSASDFSGDGRADIAAIDSHNDLRLYAGDGVGHVTGGALMSAGGGLWAGWTRIASADINADGHGDLIGVDPAGDLRWFAGDGAGHVASTGVLLWPAGGVWKTVRFLMAADFDGDCRADIAVVNGASNLYLYRGDGAGHLSAGTLMWPANGGWAGFTAVVAGDFTGDCRTDVAGLNAYHDAWLAVGDGTGSLIVTGAGASMWPTGGLWGGFFRLLAADFSGDGHIDLPGVNAYGDLGLYQGDGTGHLITGTGGYMWPGGGVWGGFHAATATDSSGTCATARTVIDPMGDSITYGTASTSGDGYRRPLADLLNTTAPMGDRWLYEGGQNTGQRWWSHDGYGGWTIDQLAAAVPTWLPNRRNAWQPISLVLLDAGTNDAGTHSGAQMLASMSGLLDAILASTPNVRVVAAQITITTGLTAGQRQAEADFDAGLPALAAAKGPRVAVVDMRGVALSGDLRHPNDAGYQDMANRWYATLAATGWLP